MSKATPTKTSRFNGADYKHERDSARLSSQHARLFNLMADGHFRTLKAIADHTKDPEASISAQLRHMRKPRFGQHEVNRRHLGHGLYEYQLVVNISKMPNFFEEKTHEK